MREFLLPYGKETLKAEIEEEHLAGVLVSELHDYKAPMEEAGWCRRRWRKEGIIRSISSPDI